MLGKQLTVVGAAVCQALAMPAQAEAQANSAITPTVPEQTLTDVTLRLCGRRWCARLALRAKALR
jgi:hypothetical protein